jgi:radical SAM protein with 4Fe4S-binding SPASM domain
MHTSRLAWRGIAYSLHRVHSTYSVPTALGLCLTHLCNIQCAYCMRQKFTPKPGNMSLENIKYLLRKMPYISTITIQGLCEPYLNPETPAIITWLKNQGYHISFTTNGTIPLTGERLDCLRSVDDFVISIDTSDPETFTYLRGGAKLNIVKENLERVVEMKRKMGLGKHDNPPMHINAVITALNFNQMKDLIAMLEPYEDQITYLMVDPVSRPDYSKFNPLALEHDKSFELWIEDFKAYVAKSKIHVVGLDYMLQPSYNWRDCPIAPMNLWVEPNGDIYYCYGFDYVIGNVFTENPLLAFNNKKARSFRQKLLTGDPPLQQCHSCNFARPGWQIHGGYLAQSRRLSVNKPMTLYEALKHVLSTLTRKGGYSF